MKKILIPTILLIATIALFLFSYTLLISPYITAFKEAQATQVFTNEYKIVLTKFDLNKPKYSIVYKLKKEEQGANAYIKLIELKRISPFAFEVDNDKIYTTFVSDYSYNETTEIVQKYDLTKETPDSEKLPSVESNKSTNGKMNLDDKYHLDLKGIKSELTLNNIKEKISTKKIYKNMTYNQLKTEIGKKPDRGWSGKIDEVHFKLNDSQINFISFGFDVDALLKPNEARLIQIKIINNDRSMIELKINPEGNFDVSP